MNPLTITILLFVFSILLLGGSASYLVRALAFIAKRIGVSEFIIGSMILAIATTLPELTSTVIANLRGMPTLGIGIILGSVVTNLCLILGIISLIRTQKVKSKTETGTIIFALSPIILLALLAYNGVISRWEGVLLLLVFAVYIGYLISAGVLVSRKKPKFKKLRLHYVIVPLAVFTLIVAAWLLVSTAEAIALTIGIPLAVIGLIFVAFGTSVPELASSISATFSGEENLAIGDLIGANITVVLFVIGVAAILNPIHLVFNQFRISMIIGFIGTFLFLSYIRVHGKTDRVLGATLIGLYLVYLTLTWFGV